MDPRYKSPESSVLQNDGGEFRDLQVHTTLLVWLLRLGAVFAVLTVWSHWMQLELLGRHFTLEEAHANDLRERVVNFSTLAVALVCYVVFARWIVVAHRNLPPLGLAYPDFTPGWALGWFFVPIANLWKPYQAMRMLWKASCDTRDWQDQNEHPLLVAWWSMWVVSALIGAFVLNLTHRGQSIPDLIETTRGVMISYALRIPQYVLAWLLVQKIWDAQLAQRRRQLAGMSSASQAALVAPT